MKKFLLVLAILFFSTSLAYAEWVNSYTRDDGTFVQGYFRSDSNDTVRDNYSYEGNTNPYTGEEGHNHYRNSPSSEYYEPNDLTHGTLDKKFGTHIFSED